LRTASVGALVLRRGADRSWPDQPLVVTNGDLAFDSIGFQVPLSEIYRTTWLAADLAAGG